MRHIITVAERQNIRRIVVCTAWGVKETIKDIPWWFRWLIHNSNIGVTYKDHERQEDLLTGSGLDWTIVRPVGLTNSTREETVRVTTGNEPRPGLTISRRMVARFMLTAVEDGTYIRSLPVISA